MLVGFWLLPRFAAPLVGGWTEVAGVVIRSGDAFLVPGLVLVAVGVAIAFGANRLIALGREHTLCGRPEGTDATRHRRREDLAQLGLTPRTVPVIRDRRSPCGT